MNILQLTHTDISKDSRILKEIKSLARNKDYIIEGLGIELNDDSAEAEINLQNVKIRSMKLFAKKMSFLPRQLRHPLVFIELLFKILIKTANLKIDVVHCHDTLVLPIGLLIKKIKKAKLIYDAHELESNKNGQTKFMSWGTFFIEKKCWKYVDLLISVSDSILEWYNKHLGNKKNILLLNAPEMPKTKTINHLHLSKEKNYFHSKYDLPKNTLIFLYIGFLTKGRGINKIIQVFKNKELRSHVVFLGYGDYKNLIIKATKNNNKIHYHPPVKHDEVVEISKSADIGLCLIENISLSDYYCLPNKLFEYAFSNLPILSSNFPELRKINERYKLGVLCENDISSIEDAIKTIEKSPLEKLNNNIAELSWEFQEKKLLEAYKNLI